MFRNLSISIKLGISFLAATLLLSGISVLSLLSLGKANSGLGELVSGPFALKEQTDLSQVSMLQLARDIRDFYIQAGGAEATAHSDVTASYQDKIKQDKEELNQLLDTLEQNGEAAAAEEILHYRKTIDTWLAIGDRIVEAVVRHDNATAARLILKDCPEALDAADAVAQSLQDKASAAVQAETARSLRVMRLTFLFALAVFAAAICLTAILFFRLRRSILPPLKEVEHYAQELSAGRLDGTVRYQSGDELGSLAESMRTSGQILSSYIAEIDRIMREFSAGNFGVSPEQHFEGDFQQIEVSVNLFIETISALLADMNQFVNNVSQGAQEVSVGAQNLAQGSTEQAGSIQEIASTVRDTTHKVTANAEQANRASDTAHKAEDDLDFCMKKMQSMNEAMAQIEQAVSQISQIIGSIQEISFQTKLLALNAAVEAAHAGSAGKGFAVVAGEVRQLAVKSAEAASNTTGYIQHTIEAVRQGSLISHDMSEALFSTLGSVQQTTEMMGSISQACAEQAELLSSIDHSVSQISIVVQNNAATAQEEAAASEELFRMAAALRHLVERFHTKER